MITFQIPGDRKWLRAPYLPTRGESLAGHDTGGLPGEVQAEIRREALAVIRSLEQRVRPVISNPPPDLIVEKMRMFMGEDVGAEYGPVLAGELALRLQPETPDPTPGGVPIADGFWRSLRMIQGADTIRRSGSSQSLV